MHDPSVALQRAVEVNIAHRLKETAALDGKAVLRQVYVGQSERLYHLLVFQKSHVRRAVGIDHAVHAVVSVMDLLPHITAVEIARGGIASVSARHGVVAKFPHASAKKAVLAPDEIPIVRKISGAVAHRVRIFAKE